jgi:hypothetical protein
MDTRSYYVKLLSEVLVAGDSPDLAYQARTRLRQALLALERGPYGEELPSPAAISPEVARITRRLETCVLHLCQPSEALDARWRKEWAAVSADVRQLERLVAAHLEFPRFCGVLSTCGASVAGRMDTDAEDEAAVPG